MEPAYKNFVDRLYAQEVEWRTGRRLLRPYLQRHPQRVEDLRRLLPQALHGVEAHWTLCDGQLVLERLQLPGGCEPLEEMLLWHALFPGLRAPVQAWWVDGRWLFHVFVPNFGAKGYRERFTFLRGRLRAHEVRGPMSEEEFRFWMRWVLLPLYPVGLPLLFAWLWWKQLREEPRQVQWMMLRIMVVAYVGMPYYCLHPLFLDHPLLVRLRERVEARREEVEQEDLIEQLLQPEAR